MCAQCFSSYTCIFFEDRKGRQKNKVPILAVCSVKGGGVNPHFLTFGWKLVLIVFSFNQYNKLLKHKKSYFFYKKIDFWAENTTSFWENTPLKARGRGGGVWPWAEHSAAKRMNTL